MVDGERARPGGPMILDPREGDAEDDHSSTKSRSLAAIAGSLLAEISLVKLAVAWGMLVLVPGILFGLAPLVAGAWLQTVSDKVTAVAGIGSLLLLAIPLAVAWVGARPLFRAAERSFWSMNSVAVQPGYALCREGLRHLAVVLDVAGRNDRGRQRVGVATAALGGVLAGAGGLGLAALAWPATRWTSSAADLVQVQHLIAPALANTAVFLGAYLAVAAITWGIADATMDQPRDVVPDADPSGGPTFRVAHLSDVHVVGERWGLRIESGRAGPRGNGRFRAVMDRLSAIDREDSLDILMVSGDMTDAGRSSEWAEFLTILAAHPGLAARTVVLPGNHDLNIVDRANPARLDLPWSTTKRLRQMRTLSAIAAVQGERAFVVDRRTGRPIRTLAEALEPHRARIVRFADAPMLSDGIGLAAVWADAFPMLLPPPAPGGLGVIVLNSNAETHFSFTNALGLVSAEDMIVVGRILAAYPQARFVVALHHHLVEYPRPAKALSERIGTALVNGSAVVRALKPHAHRLVAMHGHRHIDWIGACGPLVIVSAPSPVMDARDSDPTSFLIHTLEATAGGGLTLRPPQRIVMPGAAPDPSGF
jgi:3',5'-cyclic AMP phosphodiesterase CpdA